MTKKAPSRRKRRTREHVIADLSANFVERQALLCGYSVERVIHDYGIDLWIATYNAQGEIESCEIRVQLKATDHLKVIENGRGVVLRVDRADLDYWLEQTMPVILVHFDAKSDIAYWLYVQAHFAGEKRRQLPKAGSRITIRLSTENTVDPAAIRRFAEYRDKVVAQTKGVIHRG